LKFTSYRFDNSVSVSHFFCKHAAKYILLISNQADFPYGFSNGFTGELKESPDFYNVFQEYSNDFSNSVVISWSCLEDFQLWGKRSARSRE